MVPLSTYSLMNLYSSSSLTCNRRMLRLMRVVGAPTFNLMAWSHDRFGGNFFGSCSSNTQACFRYCGGTKVFGSMVGVVESTTLPIMVCNVGLICRGRNRAFVVLGLLNTIGSWLWEIHPLAQSILGCVTVNHGYPRMTWFLPRSERKYLRVY